MKKKEKIIDKDQIGLIMQKKHRSKTMEYMEKELKNVDLEPIDLGPLPEHIKERLNNVEVGLDFGPLTDKYSRLGGLIERLPADQYLIIMSHLSGQTFAQMAMLFNTTEAAIRNKHNRLINKLRILSGVK